ncbi:regulatory protein RecX [Dactylosporangium sp. NPDC050588]|uniref:regulatory protein RecX n=1 Tax=Dactylosporangium sp. NPDC050588 TaxID=3157211 RepID=UPI0033EAD2C4
MPERQGESALWGDPAEAGPQSDPQQDGFGQWGDGSEGRSGRRSGSRRGGQPAAPLDPREAAREICLRQLAVRPRTRLELATAMRKRGVEDEIADEILDRYDEVGIIDDAAFARAWVASRHHGKGLSRRALAGELRRKGVSSDEVGEALDELDPDVEEQTARALVARRLRVESNASPEAVFRRLVGMLARKGYPPGMAIRLVKEGLAARDDAAEFADGIDADALADVALDPDQR